MTYPVRYDAQYPERQSRWKLLIWKLVSSVPHVFVLVPLTVSLIVVIPMGWVGILIQGRFPKGLHQYAAGVLRWGTRVLAYLVSLTDEFPPFSLSADPAPAGRNAARKSAIAGTLVIAVIVGACAAFATFADEHVTREVSYQSLLTRNPTAEESSATVSSGVVQLTAAADPADALYAPLLRPQAGHRFLELELVIKNERGKDEVIPVSTSHFSLKDTARNSHAPVLAMVGDKLAPADIASGDVATVRLAFEVPTGADPAELRYNVIDYVNKPRVGETIVYTFR